MSEPLEERIAVAMLERLRTIQAGTVNYEDPDPPASVVYHTTPALVTRSLLEIDQYSDFPVYGLTRGSGSTYKLLTPTKAERHLVFNIEGYVQGDVEAVAGAVLAHTRLARAWEDVRNCFRSNQTLNRLVLSVLPDGEMDTDDGALEPQGWFRQPYRIHVNETLPPLAA